MRNAIDLACLGYVGLLDRVSGVVDLEYERQQRPHSSVGKEDKDEKHEKCTENTMMRPATGLSPNPAVLEGLKQNYHGMPRSS